MSRPPNLISTTSWIKLLFFIKFLSAGFDPIVIRDKLVNIDRLQYTCTRRHSLGRNCTIYKWIGAKGVVKCANTLVLVCSNQ